jgi:hypothetical protein
VELVFSRRVQLGGRVLDEQGNPASARIDLLACGGLASRVASRTVDGEGAFLFDGLESRRYDLVAVDGAGRIATLFEQELQAVSDLDRPALRLAPGGTLGIQVLQGPVIQRLVVIHGGHAVVSADIRTHVPLELLLPVGEVELHLSPGAQRVAESSARIVAGETVRVDL